MLNPNYNYINPITSNLTSNIAKGVPFPSQDRNPIRQTDENYNNNRFNQEQSPHYQKVMYSPKLSPSTASSTVSFLKARNLNSVVYKHNEAVTRFYNISVMNISSSQQKNRVNLLL